MSTKRTNATTKPNLQELFATLKDSIGLTDKSMAQGEAARFEALEARVLLSANPLDPVLTPSTAQDDDAALLNTALPAINVPAAQQLADSGDSAFQPMAEKLTRAAAPTVEIIHDGGDAINVGDTIHITVVGGGELPIYSRSLTVNNVLLDLDSTHTATFTFTQPGRYNFVAVVRNTDGVLSNTTLRINIAEFSDTERPVVDILHNGGEKIYTGQRVDFTVNATDDVGVVRRTFSINGQVIALNGSNSASFTFTEAGTYTIYAEAFDAAGNKGYDTVYLEVMNAKDTEKPVVTITQDAVGSIILGENVGFTVTATDNIAVTSLTVTLDGQEIGVGANGRFYRAFYGFGTYTFEAVARDAAGNEGRCNLNVTITAPDTEAPVVRIQQEAGNAITLGEDVGFLVTATDNVGVTSLSVTLDGREIAVDANGRFTYAFTSYGTYSFVAVARDAAGNVDRFVLEVTVLDREKPVVSIQHNAGSTVNPGEAINFQVTAADNVGVVAKAVTINGQQVSLTADGRFSYAFAGPGDYTIYATATDAAGNVGDCTLILTIQEPADSEKPVVKIDHSLGSTIDIGQNVDFLVTATDNVGVVGKTVTVNGREVALTADGRFSYAFPEAGNYVIVATATDAAGNTGSDTIMITVSAPADRESPVIRVDRNGSAVITEGQNVAFTVTATDNVGVASLTVTMNGVDVTLDQNGRFDYAFGGAGSYVILVTAKDAAGNTSRYEQTIIVSERVSAPPTVSVIHDGGSIKTGDNVGFTVVVDSERTIVSKTLTVNGQTVTLDANGKGNFTFTEAGSYWVVATAIDDTGRTGAAATIITVTAGNTILDTEAPVVTIVHDAPETLYPGQPVNIGVIATDNVGVVSRSLTINGQSVQLDANGYINHTFTQSGTYTLVGIAYDAAGNVGMQTLTLIVAARDVEAPVVILEHSGDGNVYAGDNILFTVNATDNVGVVSRSLTVNGVQVDLDAYNRGEYVFTRPGTYVIVGMAFDAGGNVGMQTITLTVKEARDTEAPVINITHNAPGNLQPGGRVDFTVTATDNVGVVSTVFLIDGQVAALDSVGNASHVFTTAGDHTVIAVAMDAAGNISTKTLVITVNPELDVEAPVVTIVHDGGLAVSEGRTINITVNATDNVGVVSRTLTVNGKTVALDDTYQARYTFTDAGTYVIVATAKDAAGHVGTQTVVINVTAPRDAEAPVVTVTHDGDDVITAGRTVTFTVTATDNVAVVSTVFMINGTVVPLDAAGHASYTFSSPGYYSIVAMAVDAAGNVGAYSTIIQVVEAGDVDAPMVFLEHDSSGYLTPGQTVHFTVKALDNVEVVSRTLTINGQSYPLDSAFSADVVFTTPGDYVIYATATDAAGNVGTQTITLTVKGAADTDDDAPEVDIRHDGGNSILEGETVGFTVTARDDIGVESLRVTVNGSVVTLDADGRFDYVFTAAGTYTIEAVAVDAAGNSSTEQLILVVTLPVDRVAPTVDIIPGSDAIYAGDTVDFTVVARDNTGVDSLVVTVNGEQVTLVDGKFSYTFAEGSYTIVATARDERGNVGTATLEMTVIQRDSEAPRVSIGYNARGGVYTNDTVAFTVTATDNVGVTSLVVTVNGREVTLVDGKFDYLFAAAGSYTITAVARDAQGNSNSATLTLTVVDRDTVAPTVTIARDTETVYTGDTVLFTVDARDDVAVHSVTVTVNGQKVTLVDGRFTYIFAAAGTYTVIARAMDTQGNVSDDAVMTITVIDRDTEKPTLDIIGDTDGHIEGDDVSFKVEANDNVGVTEIVVTVNGREVTVGNDGSFSFTVIEGKNVITVIARDAQGNETTVSKEFDVIARDTDAPSINIIGETDGHIEGDDVSFRVEASDNVGVTEIVVTVNGKQVVVGNDGSFSFTVIEGKNVITAIARDAQGNETTVTKEFTVIARDSEAPTVSIIGGTEGIIDGDTPEFVIDARDNVAVTDLVVTVNGETIALQNGNRLIFAVSTGRYVITVVARDAQGNETTVTKEFTVIARDSEKPSVSIIGETDGYIEGDDAGFRVEASDNVGVTEIVVTVNGKQVVINNDGSFSFTVIEGKNVITVIARDAQGNETTVSKEFDVIARDTDAPSINIIGETDGHIEGDDVTFVVEANDNVAVTEIVVTVNGREVTVGNDGSFSFTVIEGKNVITVVARDAQGNETTVTKEFTVIARDTEAPTVSIIGGTEGIIDGDTPEFVIDARDNVAVTDLVVTVNGETIALQNGNRLIFTVSTGRYVITVVARDAQGNETTVSKEFDVIARDTEKPTVSIIGETEGHIEDDDVSFKVEANDNVGVTEIVVTVNGKQVVVNNDGSFSFTVIEGKNVITVIARDAQGNETTVSKEFTVIARDTEKPTVNIIGGTEGIIDGDTPEFVIDARDNVAVTDLVVTVNGETIALQNGNRLIFAVSTGRYVITATARDAQGNETTVTKEFIVIARDTDAPSINIIGETDGHIEGDDVSFKVEASDNVGVKEIVVTVNGKQVVVENDGSFSFTVIEGKNVITVIARDAQGNEGEASLTFSAKERDATAPIVDLTRLGSGAVFTGDSVRFNVEARDNVGVDSTTLTVNGKEIALSGNGLADYTFTTAGAYVIVATAKDAAGNVGTDSLTIIVKKETVAPTVTLSRDGDGKVYVGDSVTFTVTANDNVGVTNKTLAINGRTVQLDAAGNARYSFERSGTYTIVATARDAAGNSASDSMTITVTVRDDIKPEVTITRDRDTVFAGQTVRFTVRATDNVGVETLTVTVNGQEVALVNGQFSHKFAATGDYTITATATDAQGNIGTATMIVKVLTDVSAPLVTINHNGGEGIRQGSRVTFTIDASDNVGVVGKSFSINGTAVALSPGGMAVFTFAEAGKYNLEAKAWDAAGNVTREQLILTVLGPLDEKAPTIIIDALGGVGTIVAGQTVDFTVTAADNVGVAWLEFSINGESLSFDADGKVSYTFVEPGEYVLIAYATDEAGNIGEQKVTLTVL